MPIQKGDKKMINVILTDRCYGEKTFLLLTEDQLRLLEWLGEEDLLSYDVDIETLETDLFKTI